MASDTKKRRLSALEKREHAPSMSNAPRIAVSAQRGPASSSAPHRVKFQGQQSGAAKQSPKSAAAPQDPIYASLPQTARVEYPGGCSGIQREPIEDPGDFLDDLLRQLLASSSKAIDATATLESKLHDKVLLLDNPGGPAAVARADRVRRRQQRDASKRSSHHMSARQHRLRGTYEIPLELQRYDLYLPLHDLWKTYITSLLSDASPSSVESRLLAADLHGSILAVVRAKDPTLVGKSGIVVKEMANAFSVITSDNRLAVLPKRGAVFRVQVEATSVTMFGDALLTLRAPQRPGTSKRHKNGTMEL